MLSPARRAVVRYPPSWTRTTVALIVAAVSFGLGYRNGAFGTQSWTTIGVLAWWSVLLVGLLGLWSLRKLPKPALIIAGLLAALSLWTIASALWASSPEKAFVEFARTGLYLGIFVFVAATARWELADVWSDGIAAGLTAVATVALASRFFRGLFASQTLIYFLPGSESRLSFPVNYWNGLAILIALGFPLVFRAALAPRRALLRGAALVPVPALASAIYLTSSRGGALAAVGGTATLIFFAANPWAAAGAVAVGAGGSAIAIVLLSHRDALVNDPIYAAQAVPEGHSAALWLMVICIATGSAYAIAASRLPHVRPGRRATTAAGAIGLLLVVAAVSLSHPVRHFNSFKEPQLALGVNHPVTGHLLRTASTGRWQEWTAAVAEFKSAPVLGGGAGSYEAWWAQHGTLAIFVTEAHSLYLEMLGELGLVGLALVAAFILGGLAFGIRRCLRAHGLTRTTLAAFVGSFVAYAVAAATDWIWEIPAITIVAIACLALMFVGVPQEERKLGRSVAACAAAVAVIFAATEADLLLTQALLDRSRSAAAATDWPRALSNARTARALEPWAASPPLQLALVEERLGHLHAAAADARTATSKDPSDWRNWLISARLQTKLGHDQAAQCDLYAAAYRNPRSPLFRRLAPRAAGVLATCPEETRE